MLRRGFLQMTVALSLLTALTLVYAVSSVAQPISEVSPENHSAEVVRSFYDAVNTTLRLGDTTALAQVTHPAFVVQGPGTGANLDRGDFAEQIMALRDAYPELQITVNDLLADRERVLARISITGAELGLLGSPTPDIPPGMLTETLRVEGGHVVEYGGVLADLRPPFRMLQETIPGQGDRQAISVWRLTMSRHAQLDGQIAVGPTMVSPESGTISVRIYGKGTIRRVSARSSPASPQPTEPGGDNMLGQGDQVTISEGARYALRASGETPAAVTVATVQQAGTQPLSDQPQVRQSAPAPTSVITAPGEPAAPLGVERQPLLLLAPLEPTAPAVSISIWQIALAPGMTISGAPPKGAAYVTALSGHALIETAIENVGGEMTALTVGQAVPLDPRARTSARNVDRTPAVLLVVIAQPTNDPVTVEGPDLHATSSNSACPNGGQSCGPR